MKKIILTLAALMMLIAAPIMTSCSNDMDEVAPAGQSRMATIEIAFPDQPETRAVIEGTQTGMKVTAWKAGDKVTLAKVSYDNFTPSSLAATAEFTYVSGNTFSGELPEGVSNVSEFNFAAHHATITYSNSKLIFSPTTKASTDLAEVLIMAGQKDGDGNIKMEIKGNYIRLVNYASDVSVAFRTKNRKGDLTVTYYYQQISINSSGWDYTPASSSTSDGMFFTIHGGGATNYIFFGHWKNNNFSMGLADADGNWVLSAKNGSPNVVTGKIYDGGTYPKP